MVMTRCLNYLDNGTKAREQQNQPIADFCLFPFAIVMVMTRCLNYLDKGTKAREQQQKIRQWLIFIFFFIIIKIASNLVLFLF
jgi:hypothetical protein